MQSTTPARPRQAHDRRMLEERELWSAHVGRGLEPTGPPRGRPAHGHAAVPVRATLDAEAHERLRRLTRGSAPLTFTVLVSALQVCLSRYGAAERVAVGVPRREARGAEAGRGLPLVDEVNDAESFRDRLARTRQALAEAHAREGTALGPVMGDLGYDAGERGYGVYRVALGLRGLHPALADDDADVVVWCDAGEEALSMEARYRPELYERDAVERFVGHLATTLASLLEDPARAVGAAQVLPPAELALLESWTRTEEFPAEGSLHGRFARQAALTPHAVALTYLDERVTYAELNERANRIAHRLRRAGAGHESRVVLLLERSAGMVAAILGVLKAGAAYVPVDPDYPADRIAYTLADCGARLVLTHSALADRLGPSGAAVLFIDEAGLDAERSDDPEEVAGPGSLAYVIYTSGSTGGPKGVQVTHGNVLRLFTATDAWFGFGADDVWTLFHSYAFDFSVWELWGALLYGGRLVVVSFWAGRTPELFRRLLADEGVTVLNQTPSAFRQLSAADEAAGPDAAKLALRHVVFGGEALEVETLRGWMERHGDDLPRLVNMYGITETTVHVTYRPITRDDLGRAGASPIGIAIPDLAVHVLDAAGRPAPVGVAGEMCVAGAGLARGYLNRPALTSARFVAHTSAGGERLYRSGDLGRWLPSGELEYLGRMDFQVKVRGFRIELGEIEAALLAHPGVREAAVLAHARPSGDTTLAAYVVAGPEGADASELRAALGARLPDYMVPSAFVFLPSFPLTSNGKLDRRALPAPGAGAQGGGYVEPATAVERRLAEIWAEVLEVPRVGAADHFFESGGHSLLAARVVARVREAFGVELALRTLFEAPTLAGLAAALEAAIAEDARADDAPPLVAVPRAGALPLSFAQQRLWFIDQLEPGSAAYNIPVALRLAGALDVDVLDRALTEVVRRHEALRTTFAVAEGEPVQVVHPAAPVRVGTEDLRNLAPGAREAEARRRAALEAATPFDLARGPVFRVRLLKLDREDHVLLCTQHHIASDRWSIGVLVREVSALYGAFLRGEASPLAELPVQYADYAVWQRRHLSGARLELQLAYWRDRLAGAPPVLELPADSPRDGAADDRGGRVAVELDPVVAQALRALARREGATPFMVFLAAYLLLLSRHAGTHDVVVGTPVAGRTRGEVEGLIGFFVNTLVLRGDLAGDPTFRELLRRVREVVLEAQANQDVPFERLVDDLGVERSLEHSPLFQVMFTLDEAAESPLALAGVRAEALPSAGGAAHFDLSLGLFGRGDGYRAILEYRAARFRPETAERFARRYLHLLGEIAADSARPLSALPMLSADEREAVLETGRGPVREYPAAATLAELFEAQAARTPDAPAAACDGESLTYAQLNAAANRLAHHLRGLGAGPESRVALFLERSLHTAVATLAVLKAGAAYVPLDPGYPAERVAYMRADSAAPLVLTVSALAAEIEGATVVCLDTLDLAMESAEDPRPLAGPESLAYVIYTSGSTGRPKGAMVEHGSLVCYATEMAERLGLGEGERVLQFASPGFDVVIEELFPAWVSGACVVFSRAELMDPPVLTRVLEEEGISVVELPTAFWHEWVHELARTGRALPKTLRRVLVGGERVSAERLAEWAGLGVQLVHVFGLTETTCTSSILELPAGDAGERWASLPIGTPLANVELYVVDAALNPVPSGVAGELLIGGRGVGRGYLGRPSLTAERFIPHPFGGQPGARVYRTGDRVRWLADGTMEFLGRADHQVKIRGFRIEPGEVEAVLERHPAVREAFVMVREDAPGDRRLVAYVTGTEAADLREHVAASLPGYMVPGAIVFMDALPLSPNGKVDRRALPVPGSAEELYVAPRTPAEETLAAIWAEVLRVERVGAHDNFFGLGGHSLLAMRVVSRVREAFGAELPLRALFEAPTVAGLAERLAEADRSAAMPAITRAPRGGPLPLSSGQRRLWFIDQLEPGSAAYNVPVALRLSGALDVDALDRALTEVVRRHEVLRTTFEVVEGEPVQVIHPAAPVRVGTEDLRNLAPEAREAEARRRAAMEAAAPFDLARGPVFRARLLKLEREEHVLLFTQHHIASDAWSMEVLVREVGTLYGAFLRGEPSPLPELTVQYADYAVWQRGLETVLDGQLAYWRERLDGVPPLLEIPTDRPRPAVASERGGTVHFRVPPEVSRAVAELSRREGATPYMTLLAAFQLLLSRYAGTPDVVVGTPVAGRTRGETEGLIGFFINMLVLRGDLSGDPTFRALLRQTRERVLEAQANQDVPFERLVDELRVERSLQYTPLFQVMFTVDPPPPPPAELDGLELHPLGVAHEEMPFDLGLSLGEVDGGLAGSLLFRADLFDATTAARMMEHFVRLLGKVAAHPDRALSALPVLSADEREAVLETGRGPVREYPAGATLAELFEAQAARTPDAPAAACDGESLTYAQLNAAANRLAHHLRGLGAGPESRVALFLERSLHTAVATLAVLKAGAAYVPLDPGYPAERVAYMRADSAAPLVLTVSALAAEIEGATVLCLDTLELDGHSAENPRPLAGPESLAYVIYTSGSTGRPKGAMVEHGSLVCYATEMAERLGLGEGERVLQFASPGFDVVIEELFPAWVSGACVVFSRAELMDPPVLTRVLEEEGISVVELPTAFWHEWVHELARTGRALPNTLRRVLVGGERVSAERLAEWAGLGVELVHVFGLTETTCTSSILELPAGDAGERWASLPLGGALANVEMYVVDAALNPVPSGVAGELLIGGRGVGRGYLGRPSLTAERFIPHPFGGPPGARVYRTGDRVRWLADGTMEFLGRADHQVKIRGFRIEPGEVEAVLERHPAVREAFVMVREDAPGDHRLAAYVTPSREYRRVPVGLARARAEIWPSHGEYPIYDELLYRAMVDDAMRNAGYREALAGVMEGKVALDVGTGGEAFLARLCVEAGARRVYAVEAMEASYHQACETVRALGLEDRITVLLGDATTLEIPEPVDVCISELIGCIGGSEGAVAILNRVRRWLKPGAEMIPRRCVTRVAAVELPAELRDDAALEPLGVHYAERVFGAVGHRFDLRVCLRGLPGAQLLSEGEIFEELDFRDASAEEYERDVALRVERAGRLDGLVLWVQLHPGERLAMDALRDECSFLPMYFPLFDGGIEVGAGDVVRARCEVRLSQNGINPDYHVRGVLERADGTAAPFAHDSFHTRVSETPSTFHARLFDAPPRAEETPVDAGALRAHLAAGLPDYMVPGAVVFLDALPLSPNGKVDRRALPLPGTVTELYVAPRTPAEETLAAIWAEVLRVERVGVDDNFFDLGGHSLLAMQVVSRVRQAFGAELPLRALFEAPTVAGLAALLPEGDLLDRVSDDDLLARLAELDSLSDEEVARLLAGT